MFFIDRLLQGRRIVTKVLIFVVPLVVLIAGVGLVGYHTANILNGHMTVTRATIENISDFENLQAALQEFTGSPSEETRQGLADKIDAQERGVLRLSGLLSDDQRAKIGPVSELAAKMRTQEAALFSIRQKQDSDVEAIQKAVQNIEATAKAAGKQIDIIRKDFSDKETFAKKLLYDAAAMRTPS